MKVQGGLVDYLLKWFIKINESNCSFSMRIHLFGRLLTTFSLSCKLQVVTVNGSGKDISLLFLIRILYFNTPCSIFFKDVFCKVSPSVKKKKKKLHY